MRWVRQDAATEDSCGQCAIAMLLGITKREAIVRVGHDEGTDTPELSRVIRDAGWTVARRLRRFRSFEEIPTERALLLGYWQRYPHWMAWTTGRLFDPVEGVIAVAGETVPRPLRVTHYLWMSRPLVAVPRAFKTRQARA